MLYLLVSPGESDVKTRSQTNAELEPSLSTLQDPFLDARCLRNNMDLTAHIASHKLTPRMLNELVEKIEVYNAEKIDGAWEQRLRIHYNCVGEITIPKMLPLPIPDVTVNTRKGVFVNYAPAEIAG